MDINLECYKAFYYAAKFKSVSKAAKQLYLTQPAVSQSLHRLEEGLGGVKLFARTSRGITLTPEGMLLYSHIEKAFSLINAGQTKVTRFSQLGEGELFIGATETGLFHYLIPHLSAFQKRYPNMKIHIQGCYSQDLMEMLKAGDVDVAIGVTPIPQGFSMSITYLQDFQDVFVAGPAFSELSGKILTPEDILSYPLVFSMKEGSFFQSIAQWFENKQLKPEPNFNVLTTSFIYPFVENNLAIGCVPDLYARQWKKRNPQIFTVEMTELPPKRSVFVGTNRSMPLSAAGKEFIALLKQPITEDEQLFHFSDGVI